MGFLVVAAGDVTALDAPALPAWSGGAHPSPLTAAEEASPDAAELARRFNPAMAFPTADVWPVDVRYAWSDGADLMANVKGRGSYVAVPNAELERRPWDHLPARTPDGRDIRYSVDVPGDDREVGGRTLWRQRFDVLAAHFPPTQYAHLYWHDRAQGLLAIQYWFFYPFNEWVNHHEGDWEHVTVILRGSPRLGPGFVPIGCQFYFHGFRHDTDEMIRVADEAGGDHVLVYAGGRGRFLAWGGTQSGASYPFAAVYPGAGSGPFKPDEDTRRPARFIAPAEFKVILLPEPGRLDARAHPELSWLRLPFYVGQQEVRTNPPPLNWLGLAGPPVQPAWRPAWNGAAPRQLWRNRPLGRIDLPEFPRGWSVIGTPLALQ